METALLLGSSEQKPLIDGGPVPCRHRKVLKYIPPNVNGMNWCRISDINFNLDVSDVHPVLVMNVKYYMYIYIYIHIVYSILFVCKYIYIYTYTYIFNLFKSH